MIREFVRTHPHASTSLENWYDTVLKASWRSLTDVREVYPHADLVGRRTVFNIAGNNFRLISRINYQRQIVYILAILTHSEYDKEQWK
jgi:mRNA interferase HigB